MLWWLTCKIPMSTVKQLYSTCTTAMTKMNIWSWWRPSVDITCTYPCNQPQEGVDHYLTFWNWIVNSSHFHIGLTQDSDQLRNVITPTGVSCLFSSCFWSRATSSSWSPSNELLKKLEALWGQPRWREELCITHRSPFQVGKPLSVTPVSHSSYALELWTCDHEVKSERVNLQESLKNM